MARNEEKSHSMLNKWLEMKKEELAGVSRTRRPTTSAEVHSVSECEKWRGHLLKDIGRKITQIQNSSLPEKRIRDLNDEINKLLREKSRWERRIIELGGPNHFTAPKGDDDDLAGGVSVGGGRGEYKYFGEAKNLPEVKHLLKKKAEQKSDKEKDGRKAHELHKGLDADYYGFRDDDDGLLEKEEAEAERAAIEEAVRVWSEAHGGQAPEALDESDKQLVHVETLQAAPLAPTVAVPSREEIEARLLARRKEELLRKYQSPALLASLLESQAEAQAAMDT